MEVEGAAKFVNVTPATVNVLILPIGWAPKPIDGVGEVPGAWGVNVITSACACAPTKTADEITSVASIFRMTESPSNELSSKLKNTSYLN